MRQIVIVLNRKQTKKILEIINVHLKDCGLWEELEIYHLKDSRVGRLYIYTPLVIKKEQTYTK